ncbi:putative signal transducing protein [Sinomicrobium sp.]
MEEFVTIAVFTYPYEYAVLRLALEDAGIPHVFENETMVNITPFYSNALGGIQLKVHHKDVDIAIEILREFEDKGTTMRIV